MDIDLEKHIYNDIFINFDLIATYITKDKSNVVKIYNVVKYYDLEIFSKFFTKYHNILIDYFYGFIISYDVPTKNYEFVEKFYPKYINYRSAFIKAIEAGDVYLYNYFKKKQIETYFHDTFKVINYDILYDMFCNYPETLKSVSVFGAIYFNKFDQNVSNIFALRPSGIGNLLDKYITYNLHLYIKAIIKDNIVPTEAFGTMLVLQIEQLPKESQLWYSIYVIKLFFDID